MRIQHERGCPTGRSRNLGRRSGEAVNCFFERCTLPVRLRRELVIAIFVVVVVAIIFIFITITIIINITREKVLKHG
jgi:hypothetical protein